MTTLTISIPSATRTESSWCILTSRRRKIGRLRILTLGTLYPPHSIGGYEMNWRDIVSHLRSRGHEVTVLCGDWREADNGEREDDTVDRSLQLHVDALLDARRDGFREVLQRENANDAKLRALVRDGRFHGAVLGPTGGGSLGLSRRLHELSVPQLAFVFDDWPAYGPHVDRWQARLRHLGPVGDRLARRRGLPGRFRPDDIEDWVIISERTRRVAVGAGVPAARTTLLAPGPDTERFSPAAPHDWKGELLYSGRLHPDKGIEHLVRAMVALDDHRLIIKGGGDPRYREKLEGLARELGTSGRIDFAGGGDFDGIPRLYARADAVVFPSVWDEPWGLVPLEAMAVGRPVVANAVGGAAEYLRDGENALVVAPAEPTAIVGAVRRLQADPRLRERLRRGGAETVERYRYADFLDAIADRIEALPSRAAALRAQAFARAPTRR